VTNPEVIEWLRSADGVAMNPDRAHDFQCVDVIDQFAQDLTGVHWTESVGGVNGANELLDRVPDKYWIRIDNDESNPEQLPVMGDFVVYAGDAINPYGHVAAVLAATKFGPKVLQQDGSNRTRPTHVAFLKWNQPGTGPILGWLRLRDSVIRDTGAAKRI
jgi:hypothetical protein